MTSSATPCRSVTVASDRAFERTARETELALLLHDASAGDVPSFEKLYALTSARLLGVIRRIQRDQAEAEDLLQETYLKVWNSRGRFDVERGGVEQWLARIARNGAIDSHRRRERRPQALLHSSEQDVYAQLASTDVGPLEQAILTDQAALLRRCMRSLGSEQRQCLFHAFYEDLSHDEIARHTGHPLGTVKSWMRRSLQSLRVSLSPREA